MHVRCHPALLWCSLRAVRRAVFYWLDRATSHRTAHLATASTARLAATSEPTTTIVSAIAIAIYTAAAASLSAAAHPAVAIASSTALASRDAALTNGVGGRHTARALSSTGSE